MNQQSQSFVRRWGRFSLRSFFIFLTLVAIIMAWVTYERVRSRRDLEIAEQLRASGAVVTLRAPHFDLPQPPETQSWWRSLAWNVLGPRVWFVKPEFVDGRFVDCPVTELGPLVELAELRVLHLDGAQVSDFTPLAELKKLQWLGLGATSVRDLTPLAGLADLSWLDLHNTSISDVSALAGLENLEVLRLDGSRVVDLEPLGKLKNMKKLDIQRTSVSDQQFKAIQQALPNCEITR